jgi:hypothetical protein
MQTPRSTTMPVPDARTSPPATPKPDKASAVVVALLVIGFSTWVLRPASGDGGLLAERHRRRRQGDRRRLPLS